MKGVNNRTNYFLTNLILGQYDSFIQRVALHLLMWLLMCVVYYVVYNRLDPSPIVVFLISAKDLLCVMLIFYFMFYISHHIVKESSLFFYIIYLFLGFLFWNVATSVFFAILINNTSLEFSDGFKQYANLLIYPNVINIFSAKLILYQLQDFVFMAMPPIYVKTMIEISRTLNKNTVLSNEKLELEISFLKSQINPHFLFNNLNNIYLLALKKDNNAPEMIMSLSNMLRYTLYDSDSEKVLISEEIAFVRSYIELEKMRHIHGNIKLSIKGEERGVYVIPFVLSTLVENAFKHGISPKRQSYNINIEINIEKSSTTFKVVNDFVLKYNDLNKKGGVGLRNMLSRLKIYYGNKYEYNIDLVDNMYIAIIKVPII